MNRYLDYTLKELVEHYLNFLMLWNRGNLYTDRAEVHEALLKKLGLDAYDRDSEIGVNKILYNLDKEIGYVIGIEYNEKEIEKMAKKLKRKLKRAV